MDYFCTFPVFRFEFNPFLQPCTIKIRVYSVNFRKDFVGIEVAYDNEHHIFG